MAEIPRGRSATKENVYEPGIGREIMNFFYKISDASILFIVLSENKWRAFVPRHCL